VEFGFPNSDYGVEGSIANTVDFNSGLLLGVQIGNRWYFERQEEYAIGIMVNWFDISIAANAQSTNIPGFPDLAKATLDFALLEVGPVGTYKLKENKAIDGYYNLRPTILSSFVVDSDGEGLGSAGFGITHAIGFAYRYKAFYVGPEFVFGKIKGVDVVDANDINDVYGEADINAKSFRILVGFKF